MSPARVRLVRRGLALFVAAVLPVALVAGSPSYAAEPPDGEHTVLTPDGATRGEWHVRESTSGTTLVWKSDRALPMASARPEFRVGQRTIGHPRVDGRTLRLTGVVVHNPDDLQVWLGSRRLDGPTPPLRTRVAPDIERLRARDVGIDPAEPGPHETTSFDYRYANLPWKRYPSDMEVLGQAVLPEGVDDAPLVLFVHGRHEACYGGGDNGKWPCAGGSKAVPSFRGYTYLQERLATQGYATVSISANAINQQDYRDLDGGATARSKLIRHHLKLLAQKADESGTRWSGRLDMDDVVLVGHSRGGEGVNQAVVDTGRAAPYTIAGQLLLAPTDFAQQTAGYTPTVTVLPYCDGDVYDLQGQRFVDASAGLANGDNAVRSSVLVRGANHNFFNTEWTPRISAAPSFDDWSDQSDKVCGRKASETRLAPRQQRKVGLTLTTGAVRMFVQEDPEMLKLFDAPGALTTEAMGKLGLVWSHAIGGAREAVRVTDAGATASGAAERCLATTSVKKHGSVPSCAAGFGGGMRGVHWPVILDRVLSRSTLDEARLDWSRKGRAGGLGFGEPLDVSADDATLDMRVIGAPRTRRVRVRLRDSAGETWARPVRVLPLMGGGSLHPYWAQTIRLAVREAPDAFDATSVVAAEIVSTSAKGSAWIVDAAVRRPVIPEVRDETLPRLFLGEVRQREGDKGTGVVRIPYRLRGPIPQRVRFDVGVRSEAGKPVNRLVRVNVRPGQRAGSVSLRYPRNKRDDRNRSFSAVAQPVRGVALHDYLGRAVVIDDDPPPKLTITPKRATYRAGDKIRVRVRLAKPTGFLFWANARLRDAKGFAPMRGADVPRKWLRRHGGDPAHPRRKLSRALYPLSVRFPPGKRVGTLTIPTVRRGPHARTKRLRLVWQVPHHKKRTTVTTVKPPSG